MAKEICISSTPHETRLAILEDDQLAEIYYERENEYTLAGSIYNGRVTRVLPGMQSAFVDIGLERDAFLYVTDFLELEDQEETDELEKAAVSGGNQAPREVRHGNGHERGQRPGRSERQDRGDRDRKPRRRESHRSQPKRTLPRNPLRETEEQTEATRESAGEPGAKRWRGRRRRRGGRGAGNAPAGPSESQEFIETHLSEPAEPEADVASEIQAEAAPARAPRGERAAQAFVLPGESLSKYGGTPAESAQQAAPEVQAPVRPASTFKPSTLIEAPIQWDGSGLLPGESLSRHRNRQTEPEAQTSATGRFASESSSADAIEEQEFVEETAEENLHAELDPALTQPLDNTVPVPVEEDYFEETFEAVPGEHVHEAHDDLEIRSRVRGAISRCTA